MKKSLKKTIIIFLILALIFFSSIFSFFKIKKITSFSIGELKKIEENLKESAKEKIFEKTIELEENWQKDSNLLRTFLKREPLEKIDLEFIKLKNNIKSFNKTKIEKNLNTISHIFNQIEKDSKPFLFNIF